MSKFLFFVFLMGIPFNIVITHSTKICDFLLSTLEAKGKANVVINFKQKTLPILDSVNRMNFKSRGDKIAYLKKQLEEHAAEAQGNVTDILRNHGSSSSSSTATFESFWINNQIIMQGASMELVKTIAGNPEVSGIREERIIRIADRDQVNRPAGDWGLKKIEADKARHLNGENIGGGVVVATIDTGVRATHEAIRGNYRSDYGWFDPYSANEKPVDESGHGTHVMGIIAGSGGIGVAPGVQWITCKGCRQRGCTESALSRCGQWIACPTLHHGQTPDCSKAPHIVSNSWGSGSGGDQFYDFIVAAWRAAGIIPVFAIGNSGLNSKCASVNSPGDYENVIGVGATTETDNITHFSSRGPSANGRIKPDLVAPGVFVRSGWYTSDTAYHTISGTSVSAPHVAGTIALLLSKKPDLTFNQIKKILQDNADRDVGDAGNCGGTHSLEWPNNIYGYGRINARKSLAAVA